MNGILGSVIGAIREGLEALDQRNQDLRNAEFPGTLEERRKLGRMYDDGYGEHYFDAYFKAKEGQAISPHDREILERYDLLEKTGATIMPPAEAASPALMDDSPAPGPTAVRVEEAAPAEQAA